MTADGRRRLKHFAVSATLTVIVTVTAAYLIGPRVALAAGVLGFLAVAWISDDNLGTCLPLAVFLLIGLTLLVMALVGTILVFS